MSTPTEGKNTMSDDTRLVALIEESGLESTKAQTMLDQFSDYFKLAAEWEVKARAISVNDESQVAEMKMAREGRLFLRQKRVAVENTRKQLKEQSLREGKAIDGIANVLKALIVPIEEYLAEQESFVERKRRAEEEARRLEAEKLLREKEEAEAKAKAEEERRIRAENERLRQEAEALEAERRAEREAAEKARREAEAEARRKQKEIEDKARAEREAAEAKARAERAAIEAKAKADREAAVAKERKKAKAAAEKAKREAAEREAKLRSEMAERERLARLVTCPACGHTWDKTAT